VLLCAGANGKRQILPHSRVMIHQPHGGVGGTSEDILIQANEIKFLKQRLNEIIAKHSGKSLEEVTKDTNRDNYLDADEAIAYGLVDRIIVQGDD